MSLFLFGFYVMSLCDVAFSGGLQIVRYLFVLRTMGWSLRMFDFMLGRRFGADVTVKLALLQ